MGKREKHASKFHWDELSEGEGELANRKALKSVVQISSDEDEANADLSLKIVEKALLMRKAKLASENDSVASDPGGLIGQPSSSSPEVAEVDAADFKTKRVVKKDRVRKSKKRKVEDPAVSSLFSLILFLQKFVQGKLDDCCILVDFYCKTLANWSFHSFVVGFHLFLVLLNMHLCFEVTDNGP